MVQSFPSLSEKLKSFVFYNKDSFDELLLKLWTKHYSQNIRPKKFSMQFMYCLKSFVIQVALSAW